MAFDKKRSKKVEEMEFHENEEENEGENEEEEEEFVNERMELDFEGRKPENLHHNGICTLLHQVFLKLSVNVSELTDLIIKHNDVGSVLQQLAPSDDESINEDDVSDDDDGLVMSVTTVVDMSSDVDSEFAKQIRCVLLERCKALPSCEQLEHFLSSAENRIGFLINERMIGLPPHIAILESLWKDVEKAKETEPNYNFSHYLLFSKTLQPLVKASKKKKQDQSAIDRLFMNIEEELFYQNSLMSFEFSVKDQRDSSLDGAWDDDDSQSYQPFRTISIVASDKLPAIMSQMAAWISSNN